MRESLMQHGGLSSLFTIALRYVTLYPELCTAQFLPSEGQRGSVLNTGHHCILPPACSIKLAVEKLSQMGLLPYIARK